jgi:PGF-pre-PGF domain-containing protein
LNSSLQINSSTAVTFSATIQNSTLDCQGFGLDGNDASSTNGVSFQSTNKNNTVRNCIITKFQNGVYTYKGGNNTFTNNIVNSNRYGFYLYESSDNNLDGNSAGFNEDYGIYLFYNSKRNNLTNNNASHNEGVGISVQSSSNSNNIANNVASYNNDGIAVSGWGNNLTNNTANYNLPNNGIGIYGDGSHNLKYNTAKYNRYGIRVSSCDNNNLISNTVSYNSWKGIFIDLSSYNTLDNNIILKEGNQTGLHVKTSPSGNTPQHSHDIDETNTINGLPIRYYDNNYKTCPDNQTMEFGQNVSHMEFYNCENVTVKNTNLNDADGIYLTLTQDSRIENVVSSNNDYGIYLISSWNNIITNCTANSNNVGVYLYSSDDNTVSNCTVHSNNWHGIAVSLSTNDTVINNELDSNNNGIYVYSSSDSFFRNNVLNFNNKGFYVYASSDNSFSSNIVESSVEFGMHVTESIGPGVPSLNNLIYDNYFKNLNNFYLYNTNNSWNTAEEEVTNILGGEVTGGNYWGNVTGAGFSEYCNDTDFNGICDTAYLLYDDYYSSFTNNVDNLPLKSTLRIDGEECSYDSECVSNICCHEICRSNCPYCGDNYCDTGENCALDDSGCGEGYSCTDGCELIDDDDDDHHGPPPVVIPTCKAKGGVICAVNETCPGQWLKANNTDRCCSLVCAPPKKTLPINVSAQFETDVGNISANKSKTVNLSEMEEDIHLKEINIRVKKVVNRVRINIQRLVGKPQEIKEEPVPGKEVVYSYLNITAENVTENDIDNVKMVFRVNKSWILGNDLDEDKIFLNRFVGGKLEKLPTTKLREDGTCNCIYYEAESSGFSYFVITGEKRVDELVEEPEEVLQPVSYCGDGVCNAAINESCSSCAQDCGGCPVIEKQDTTSYESMMKILFAGVIIGIVLYVINKKSILKTKTRGRKKR